MLCGHPSYKILWAKRRTCSAKLLRIFPSPRGEQGSCPLFHLIGSSCISHVFQQLITRLVNVDDSNQASIQLLTPSLDSIIVRVPRNLWLLLSQSASCSLSRAELLGPLLCFVCSVCWISFIGQSGPWTNLPHASSFPHTFTYVWALFTLELP